MSCLTGCKRLTIIIAAVVFLSSTSVLGQNLITDPNFDDVSFADWPPGWVVDSTWQWDALNMIGAPGSGSGRFDNMYIGSPSYTITAGPCIENIDDTSLYDARVWINFPSGQAAQGKAFVQLAFYQQTGCLTALDNEQTLKVDELVTDTWRLSEARNVAAPPGTVSLRFMVTLTKLTSDESLRVHFDGAELEAVVFGDGFESGQLSAWSATSP